MPDQTLFYTFMDSPVGPLLLAGDGESLTHLGFSSGAKARGADPSWQRRDGLFTQPVKQLGEYFAGTRKNFDLPLAPRGTDFQRQVWAALREIGYGETCSYGAIAQSIGNANAVRAVGAANGSNPIAIVVPCHRVIGANGSLTGFGGGLDTKRFLLDLERRHSGLFA